MFYKLFDSGNQELLESFGPYTVVRPEPHALWPKSLAPEDWKKALAIYHRSEAGGGRWEYRGNMPKQWEVTWNKLRFIVKPTGFKHMGIFPEQQPVWEYVTQKITEYKTKNPGSQPHILNLFGYTGAATVAAAAAGAKVTHLDSSKEVVTWARENADANNLQTAPIRWIVDDAMTYVRRELKRGMRYEGIIIDAPKYGRGAKGEVWKIEENLPYLLDLTKQLLSSNPAFVVLISYAAGLAPAHLAIMLHSQFPDAEGDGQDLCLHQENGYEIPLASMAAVNFLNLQ
jgi:23S rRNA (cytosine1962-C5)-methyltransferase